MSTSFQLKGSLFTLSVLQLLTADLKVLAEELAAKINLAPKFFQYAPIVIDVQKLEDASSIEFSELREILTKHHLIPVGVRGADAELHTAIQQAGFAIMQDNDQMPKATKKGEANLAEGKTKDDIIQSPSLLVTEPIRSGQQVYAEGGDLIVTATISPGSELLADGNIHVYGTLRGRALAGINGDINARIFCNQLEAELVSIAGHYKIFEDVYQTDLSKVKQLHLDGDQLIISSLK